MQDNGSTLLVVGLWQGNLKFFLLTNYANENAGKFWPKIANWKTTEKF